MILILQLEAERSQSKQLRVSRDAQVRRLQKLRAGVRPSTTSGSRPQSSTRGTGAVSRVSRPQSARTARRSRR